MKIVTGILTLALAALLSGCGGDEAPPASAFTGTWRATAVVYTSTTGLGTKDIVAVGGSATLVLGADGTFQFTVTQPGGVSGTFGGTYVVNSIDLISLTRDGGINFAWAYTLSGGVLQLSCGAGTGTGGDNCAMVLGTGGGIGFDFNGDGQREPANWTMTFRQ